MNWQTTELSEAVKTAIDKEANGRFGYSNDNHQKMKSFLIEGAQLAVCALASDTIDVPNLTELATAHQEWSMAMFSDETAGTPLMKLESEINELWEAMSNRSDFGVAEEYADCIMCLFSSAAHLGINSEMISEAFAKKLEVNRLRKWVKNPDGTSSHINQD